MRPSDRAHEEAETVPEDSRNDTPTPSPSTSSVISITGELAGRVGEITVDDEELIATTPPADEAAATSAAARAPAASSAAPAAPSVGARDSRAARVAAQSRGESIFRFQFLLTNH